MAARKGTSAAGPRGRGGRKEPAAGAAKGTAPAGKAVAGKAAAGAGGAEEKAPGWTKQRLETFFSELAQLCNVAAAARAAGFDDGKPAYRRKARNAAFRARYEAAIAEGYQRLELEMLERSRFGENRAPSEGEAGPRLREIPTALGLALLKLHAGRARGGAAAAPAAPVRRPLRGAKLRDAIEARLADLNRRLGGEG